MPALQLTTRFGRADNEEALPEHEPSPARDKRTGMVD